MELEGKAKKVWEEAYQKGLRHIVDEKLADIRETMITPTPVKQVIWKIKDFNSTINYIYPDREDLYDKLRFRMFQNDCEVILFQNPEVVSEVDKMFIVNEEEYDLIDYQEVDVDVRRYGTRNTNGLDYE